jgi:hypothetical protein
MTTTPTTDYEQLAIELGSTVMLMHVAATGIQRTIQSAIDDLAEELGCPPDVDSETALILKGLHALTHAILTPEAEAFMDSDAVFAAYVDRMTRGIAAMGLL